MQSGRWAHGFCENPSLDNRKWDFGGCRCLLLPRRYLDCLRIRCRLMADPKVKLEFDGRVAVVSFNRPQRHNAVDDETALLFASILRELHSHSDLGAVVLRGEGASFSSGRDTKVLGHRAQGQNDLTFVADAQANTGLISSMPVPVVAALRGWVIGAGFERALHCDLRITTPDTRMSLPGGQLRTCP